MFSSDSKMNRANSADLICCACMKDLAVGEEFLQCMVKSCGKLFHRLCTINTLTKAEIDAWVCPECCSRLKKGGRNCDTPVGTPVSVRNVASRGVSPALIQSSQTFNDPSSMALEMQLMRDQMNLLSEQLTDAVSAVTRYKNALADCSTKLDAVCDRLKKLELAASPCSCSCRGSVGPRIDGEAVAPHKPQQRRKRNRTGESVPGVEVPVAQIQEIQTPGLTDTVASALPRSQYVDPDPKTGPMEKPLADDGNGDVSGGEFKEVRRRKRHYTSVRCTAGPDVTTLKAVEYRKYIHLWNMVSGVDEVRAYMQSICGESPCIVEELKAKGDYKSFKIGVPPGLYDSCLSADLWPDNARVKPWLFRRQSDGNRASQQPQS